MRPRMQAKRRRVAFQVVPFGHPQRLTRCQFRLFQLEDLFGRALWTRKSQAIIDQNWQIRVRLEDHVKIQAVPDPR